MYHRFHGRHKSGRVIVCLVCLLLLAVCITGTAISEQTKTDNTAALSFPASAQFMEQLNPQLSMRFLSLFPPQETTAAQTKSVLLYPGGQPVGILLRTDGILVVGYSPVQSGAHEVHPAESAGIQAGDVILSVNGTQIIHDDDFALIINRLGAQSKEITLEIQRQSRILHKTITPVYCQESKSYRIGLLIRDNAGGVGTLTFVDPATMQYGALGHMIANSETQRKLSILNGKLVAADIQGIKKGTSGSPGEKIGRFTDNTALGSIDKNTSAGIFGTISNGSILFESIEQHPLPIVSSSEIMPGPAVIYTALDGTQVQSFSIEIEKVLPAARDGKNLIIRVTDPVLLARTGGIVQGMSGSPIIQDGKLVGAVTHVLVNDPTRGYGIFIENMLDAAA